MEEAGDGFLSKVLDMADLNSSTRDRRRKTALYHPWRMLGYGERTLSARCPWLPNDAVKDAKKGIESPLSNRYVYVADNDLDVPKLVPRFPFACCIERALTYQTILRQPRGLAYWAVKLRAERLLALEPLFPSIWDSRVPQNDRKDEKKREKRAPLHFKRKGPQEWCSLLWDGPERSSLLPVGSCS